MRRFFAAFLCLALAIQPGPGTHETKYVALTFDDGPSGRFTRRLLDGLEERDVKATFLLCGYRIKDYPKEAQRIYDEGHEIGIHGYSHDSMCPMSCCDVTREIEQTAALLPEGCAPVFLRPPGGKCSDAVYKAAKEAGLAVLSWSVDPKDWAVKDASRVSQTVIDQIQDGDIVLLHDMSDSSVNAALTIIDTLSARGFRFVTVSELAKLKGVTLTPGEEYCSFP